MTHALIVAGLVLAVFGLGVVAGWSWRSARQATREFDAQIEASERVIAERHAPKHARTQPRAGGPEWKSGSQAVAAPNVSGGTMRSTFPTPTIPNATAGAMTGTKSPTGSMTGTSRPRRLVTTAVDIPPVIWPQPGTQVPLRPQAARTSGTGTQTMPRLTDTGELRKLADDWIDRMRAEDVAWRAKQGLLG